MLEEESQPTLMHRLAHAANWGALLSRIAVAPHEGLRTVRNTLWMDASQRPQFNLILTSRNIAPIHIICTHNGIPVNVLRAYLEAQPESARLKTSYGMCALHLACYLRQPLDIIQLLASAYPNALSCQDAFHGWTPFHICAVLPTAENVLSIMLATIDKATTVRTLRMKDKHGRTPLLLACSGNSMINESDFAQLYQASSVNHLERLIILEELSCAYQEILLETIRFKSLPTTPVSYNTPSRFCNPSSILPSVGSFKPPSYWQPTDSHTLWRCWNKMLVVLQGGVASNNGNELVTFPVLHECIRLDPQGKTFFFDFVLRLNPHYACQTDENGDLPLHVVARYYSNNTTSNTRWAVWLNDLLLLYPKAASMTNNHGEFPLEIFNQRISKWDPILHDVLRHYPMVLSKLKLSESIYPDVLAKLDCKGDVSTMFVILNETMSLMDHSGRVNL